MVPVPPAYLIAAEVQLDELRPSLPHLLRHLQQPAARQHHLLPAHTASGDLARGLNAGDVSGQGIEGGTALGGVEGGDRTGVAGVRRQSIDRLGRKDDEATLPQGRSRRGRSSRLRHSA